MNKDNNDVDVIETEEWLDAIESVIENEGPERAHFLIEQLLYKARSKGVNVPYKPQTPYKNTIQPEQEVPYPGDLSLEKRISNLVRWNAVAMVLQAGKHDPELGGHIASFASAAVLYEVGLYHCFHGENKDHGGDLVYFQGHSAPGIYSHAFLQGRLSEQQLANFRQEVGGRGISSYPHPWLMPDFWQFPTVSMGLGPIQAIYQARFLKYLHNRGLADTSERKVWMYCGDGEMDEPESLGALSIAAREGLDNLIIVVNCNLQRLDGPVRGNGKIVQELEGIFVGAGWNVVKVLWGDRWDPLFAKDKAGIMQKRMEEAVDGDYQNYKANDGAYVREHFFGAYPELAEMVANMSDEDIWRLNRGGHDSRKVYNAYHAAMNHKGQPTVILAKTIKGYGMGAAGEGQNITHQQKKMSIDDLKAFRNRFNIPVPEDEVAKVPFYRPNEDSAELKYLSERAKAMGGYVPARRQQADEKLTLPMLEAFAKLFEDTGEREISTTMALVRLLNVLVKDKNIGKRIVPIVPDESRTFGMEGFFRQLGIYSPLGQQYEPQDKAQIMYYKEDKAGQFLQEGINEAGGFCSWLSAATSYSHSNLTMIPFYVYYSMFGFQRIGDLAWAAGDLHARGFLFGGLSGRTSLPGEGLQHQDGHSHVLANTIPSCICYDPTYAYEIAVIVHDGMQRMYANNESVFYYVTIGNESYRHRAMPKGVEQGIIKGMYLLEKAKAKTKHTVQLLSGGTILLEALAAAELLAKDFNVGADVWSVTSYTQLYREAQDIERWNHLHPVDEPKQSHLAKCLAQQQGPVIASSDYIQLHTEQLRPYLENKTYLTLGTDGYGRSDTRDKLREFFEVNRYYIAYSALLGLVKEGELPASILTDAINKYKIDVDKPNPVTV